MEQIPIPSGLLSCLLLTQEPRQKQAGIPHRGRWAQKYCVKREIRYPFRVPTSLRIGPYRFFFYANGRDEPAHAHVQRERNTAKFWIDPVRIERSGRFRAHELLELQRIIRKNKTILLKAWHEYFNA